jgi:hypothetical protein
MPTTIIELTQADIEAMIAAAYDVDVKAVQSTVSPAHDAVYDYGHTHPSSGTYTIRVTNPNCVPTKTEGRIKPYDTFEEPPKFG